MHVGDLLCDGHKLWYRVGCGSGMPGPYGVAVGWWYRQGARAACMPPLRVGRFLNGFREGQVLAQSYLQCFQQLFAHPFQDAALAAGYLDLRRA